VNDRLRQLPPFPSEQLGQWRRELEQRAARVLDFGSDALAEPTPAPLRDALLRAVPATCGEPPVRGTPELRAAAAGYLRRRFGVTVDADTEVLATLGSKEALFHLPLTFTQVPSDKDLVVYGEPGYALYEIAAQYVEAWTWPVPLAAANDYAMDPDAVPAATLRRASVVFLNYPHDPTGACLPDALYRRWVEAREEYGFVLCSDECHVDLFDGGTAPRSLLEFGRKGCLAVHSASTRSGMAGYRAGFVAGDAELIARYARFRAAMGTAPQAFVQAAAAAAWSDDAHVRERAAQLAAKRRVLRELLAARGLRVHDSQAGPFLWAEAPAGTDGDAYAARCREAGILVAPGSLFGKGQQRFVRIALSPLLADCQAAANVWPR
jgi:succinyldiaminopimelate transaminase